jgi:hypothetical protein
MRACAGWAIDGNQSCSTTDAKRQAKDRANMAALRQRAATGTCSAAKDELERAEAGIAAACAAKEWRRELDPATRRAAGRACKVLLDLGRREALREVGLQCELVQYCSEAYTLENRLLLGWR